VRGGLVIPAAVLTSAAVGVLIGVIDRLAAWVLFPFEAEEAGAEVAGGEGFPVEEDTTAIYNRWEKRTKGE
jgi:hypothetical protein